MTPERFKKLKKTLDQRQKDLTVIMDNVHKPHNFSAILRSCDAAGIYEAHAVTSNGKITQHHDTAAGAHKWIKVHSYQSIEEPYALLKKQNYQIITAGLGDHCCDFREIDYTCPTAIVLGSELLGLSAAAEKHATINATIPMQGLVESLNVSVAAAVILFEAQRQRIDGGYYLQRQLDDETYTTTLFEWSYPEVAAINKKQGKNYPALDDNGYIINNEIKHT